MAPAYLVCATERSGSTLLCELLAATGVAGRPEEYFEFLSATGRARQPREYFPEDADPSILELLAPLDAPLAPVPHRLRLADALERGTTSNGVFGAKMMWAYLPDFLAHGEPEEQLGPLRWVHVERRDTLAQAISLWRAVQTAQWRAGERDAEVEPVFHGRAIALDLARRLEVPDAHVVPISAPEGDNVVGRSERAPYYDGPPLLELLETVEFARDRNLDDIRLPVQWVVRPRDAEPGEHRLYAGQVASGVLRAGDEIAALPEGARTRIESVETADGPLEEAYPPMSVLVRLADDLDVGRGDLLASPRRPRRSPASSRRQLLDGRRAAAPGRQAAAQAHHAHGPRDGGGAALPGRGGQPRRGARARPARAQRHRPRAAAHRLARDGRALRPQPRDRRVRARRRARARHGRRRHGPQRHRDGRRDGGRLAWEAPPLPREDRWDALGAAGATVWLRATPELLAEAGAAVERALVAAGRPAYLVDGGLSQQDLAPGRLARLFADGGQVAVAALPAASAEVRREARELHAAAGLPFVDLHIPDGEAPGRTAERVLEALDETA